MGKVIRLTENELIKLVEKVLIENINDVNNHRYWLSAAEPGIEKYFENPLDSSVENGLLAQLERDKYGKGKIIVRLNGHKFDKPAEFLFHVKRAYESGTCYKITNYTYKNPKGIGDLGILNSRITILADKVPCKKQEIVKPETAVTLPPKSETGGTLPPKSETGVTLPPKPKPKPKPKCKYKKTIPSGEEIFDLTEGQYSDINGFQKYCLAYSKDFWKKDLDNGKSISCTSKDVDGVWGCCSQTCYEMIRKNLKTTDDFPGCPPKGSINCMPSTNKQMDPRCKNEYLKKHCSSSFVY